MVSYRLGIAFSSFIFLVCISPIHAQWYPINFVNTIVCNASGYQMDARICEDGKKGAYIAWKDWRSGTPLIYAQHVDSNGVMLWGSNGLCVNPNAWDQSTPAVIPDMKGGVIISYSDVINMERDIYAQRFDAFGNRLWDSNGVIVSNHIDREHNQKMVSDGKGGAIIVFERQMFMSSIWEVWAQSIDSNGVIKWSSGPVKLSNLTTNFLNPKIQGDKKGGAIITWQDYRNGIDSDIYAQYLDVNGIAKWDTNGVLVCNASGTQNNPKIDPDSASGGVIIAWTDKRNNSDYDIYAQRIDSLGNLLWGNGGTLVCGANGNQSAVDIYSSPKVGGAIFVWKDKRWGDYDIYAQKLDSSGQHQWAIGGSVICFANYDQRNPNISGDGNGGVIIVWEDGRNGTSYDVFAQRITAGGAALWSLYGNEVSISYGSQLDPKNISDGDGGTIVVWEDTRAAEWNIYAHKLFYDGYTIGFKENSGNNISCYPNPFEDKLTITFQAEGNDFPDIKLYDVLGNELADLSKNVYLKQPGFFQCVFIDTDNELAPGLYCLSVVSKEGTFTRKVIRK